MTRIQSVLLIAKSFLIVSTVLFITKNYHCKNEYAISQGRGNDRVFLIHVHTNMAACHLWNPAVILIGLPAALDPKDSP
jgi:hypothetical protein